MKEKLLKDIEVLAGSLSKQYAAPNKAHGIMSPASEAMDAEVETYPGLEVAITHKLAPYNMQLIIGSDQNNFMYRMKNDYKYSFYYRYLDLAFSIKTDDDKVAAKLYPYFSEAQRTQIMAMTLGHRKEPNEE